MKKALVFALAASLYGGIEMQSFYAKFVQRITNDQNRTITYRGEVAYEAPDRTIWRYESPTKKTILIQGSRVIVVEPELEQATFSQLRKDRQIFSLLQKARKVAPGRYVLSLDEKNLSIFTDANDTIKRVRFKDEMDNDVEVEFVDRQKDIELDDSFFEVKIPADFDRIVR